MHAELMWHPWAMEPRGVEVVGQERTRRRRHRRHWRRDVGVAALGVLLLFTAIGLYTWQHYRMDLMGDYRAGYNAVSVDPVQDGDVDTSPCNAAIIKAHPEAKTIWEAKSWPDYLVAFDYGCSSKRSNLPYDPWHMFQVFAQGE